MGKYQKPQLDPELRRKKSAFESFVSKKRRELRNSSANFMELAGGVSVDIDYIDFVTEVHTFASRYGLGGCRSLSEFADMIDREDPVLREALLLCIQQEEFENGLAQIGEKPNYDVEDKDDVRSEPVYKEKTVTTPISGIRREIGEDFLMDSGVKAEKIKQIRDSLNRSGFEEKDFSYIVEHIKDENFDLQAVLSQMRDYVESGVNVRITPDMIMGSK